MHLRLPLLLALTLVARTSQADTSATLPTAINLPKGPASLEGFGQGYDTSPTSGLPTLSYALDVPPGRAGLAPALALRYDAADGAGTLGLGWSLGLPAIERSLRTGVPTPDVPATWTLRGLGGGEELVEVEPGVLRERIEQGPPFVVRPLPGGAMSVLATDGTGYLFGFTDDARLGGDTGLFRLELSAITDVHGNRVDFDYTHEPGSDAPLLSAITYNEGRAAVRFRYEERPDIVRTRAPGFRVELRHRLRSIVTEVQGQPVRTTTLHYARTPFNPASLLTQIDTVAADGTELPSWHLYYTGAIDEPHARILASAPALDPTAEGRAWVDLNGDALPDLLDTTAGAWRSRTNLGTDLAATWTTLPTPAATLSSAARFADLTGDGVADLLAQPGGELWAFTGGTVPFAEAMPIPVDLDFDLSATNVALADLNLDGRVDVLRHDDSDAWIWLRKFDAPGYAPAEAVPPALAGMRLGEPGVQLGDLDGDRLPDLVRILPTERRVLVAAGEGRGSFADPVDLAGVPEMHEAERWELSDITGDGAADLVRVGDTLEVHAYQHDDTFALAARVAWPELQTDEVVLFSDVDASGTVDVLRVDPTGAQPWRVWSLAERPGLLATLHTELGDRCEFTYSPAAALAAADTRAGSTWATTPPTAMPVLVRIDESDAHTPWTRVTERHVRDGWYDPARGEFRGFAELREFSEGDDTSEPATLTRRYDLGQTDEARKLQLVGSEVASPRGVLVREEHTLDVTTPVAGVRAVLRAATDVVHIEAGPESAAIRVRTEWDHDAWHNVTEERALGRLDRPGDERITTHLYAAPRRVDGPRDRLAEALVLDGAGDLVTATRTYYDGEPEEGLPLGEVDTRGAVARSETWLEGDTWTATLRQIVDPRGNVTQLRDAEGGTLRRRYDDAGLFPVEERLVLGSGADLITTATWDARLGQPQSVTAPSGATARVEYDGLGRVLAEIEPGDTADLPTTRYTYHLSDTSARPSIVTERRSRSGEPDVERTVTHLDGLGRVVLEVTADDAGTGAILSAARRFSARGEVAELIAGAPLPATALAPGAHVDVPQAPSLITHHDALGRVVWTRDPDGFETRTSYAPLVHDRHDHEDLHPEPPYTGAPVRTERDGLGHVVAITNTLAGRRITDRYEVDAAGRVTAHVDPAGHRTVYTRDGGGRLTDVLSADAGHLRQRFDRTGRLIERIDATGARITWSYDPIGRLLRERAFSADGTGLSDIRRHYDLGGPFARGQLAAVDDDAGRVEFTHDARGQIVQTTRRFDRPEGPLTLARAHTYDAQGRPLRDIYPDGSTLEHSYTARGLEAPGAFAEATYDALGRWHHLSLAPGVSLTRALDHTGRVLAQRVTQGEATLLDLTHRYDVAGQLAETHDLLDAHGVSWSQTYAYDDLRRLVARSAGGHTQRWRYSDDGNLLEQAGRALTYDPARPHAAAQIDDQHLAYDPAGQLAEVAGEGPHAAGTWRFDPHGRVMSFLAEDGRRVEHVYDYTGERAIRREYDARGGLTHETFYFGETVEVRDGQLVRWVFFAGERVAESATTMPRGGFAELPAEVVAAVHPPRGPPSSRRALVTLVLALASLLLLARRIRLPARRRWSSAALLLAALSTQSCHHDAATTRPLLPDEHTRYHVADRLGSAALILDHEGQPLARDLADPYGVARIAWRAGDLAGPTYRFTGQEDDPLSGSVAIGARHYLPALGRWASPDPLHLLDPEARLDEPGERNLYRYAANNPVNNTDPTGHGWITWIVRAGKALGKAVYKGWDKVDEFSGIADDVVTLAGAEAGIGARVLSALSLASEALPFSAGDLKSAYRWARGGDRAVDATAKAQREATKFLEEGTKSGRARRNGHLAGKEHPETGVPFDSEARADFTGVAVKEVEIEFAKPINRGKDRAAANKAAGFKETPDGYVWHHAANGKMQLVPKDVHRKTGHDGPLSPH